MHDIVRGNLEEYLRTKSGPGLPAEVDAHLAACSECRETLKIMEETSSLLAVLRPPAEAVPTPGFYARVMARVEAEDKPSVWNLLLDPIFGRRLVYGSLTVVVLLGTYLVSTEPSGLDLSASPEAILSESSRPQAVSGSAESDRDVILVNLATYKD